MSLVTPYRILAQCHFSPFLVMLRAAGLIGLMVLMAGGTGEREYLSGPL